ncbi:hypothetical protein STENM36S_03872 [Streptomyces tendae]
MRPGLVFEDSWINAVTAAIPSRMTTRPSQKIQCQSRASTIGPGMTSPTPKPMPNVDEIRLIATGTRSRGNWSRTIPNASGKAAEPTPCTARAAISRASESDRAASRVPAAKTVRLAISTRRLPNMSPTRPSRAVATDAVSRNELSTQETAVVEASNSRWRSGSAGTTIVCIREKDRTARSRAANGAAVPRCEPGAGMSVMERSSGDGRLGPLFRSTDRAPSQYRLGMIT